MQKKFAATFLAFAFALANFGILPALAAGTGTISLQPSTSAMKVGDTLNMSVVINPSGAALDTVRVELGYDAKKLQALSFTLGTMFPNLSPSNSIDNTSGVLSYGAYKFGTPVSASGTLGTVSFKALAAGTVTVSVLGSSKLISDGTENISATGNGSALIAIGATSVPEKPVVEPAKPATPASGGTQMISDKDASAAAKVVLGHTPKGEVELAAVKCLKEMGCKAAKRDLALEKAAIAKFVKLFKKSPKTSLDWNVVNTLAYTNYFVPGAKLPKAATEPAKPATPAVPATPASTVKRDLAKEKSAVDAFVKKYKKLPKSAADWKWVNDKAYGEAKVEAPVVKPEPVKVVEPATPAVPAVPATPASTIKRDLAKEKLAVDAFVKMYKKLPKSAADWKWVNDKAYGTSSVAETPKATPATPAVPASAKVTVGEPATPAVPAKVDKAQQQAIGWFGKLTGRLPGSVKATADVDWKAVDYMVKGYKPEKRDLDKESAAIKKFTKTFGHVPTSDADWNVVAAVAYSGAF